MAKANSRRTKKTASLTGSKSFKPNKGSILTVQEKAARYDETVEVARKALAELDAIRAAQTQRQAAVDADIAARERNGVTLKGPYLDQVERVLSQANLAAMSIHGLAQEIADVTSEGEAFVIAIEIAAKDICRKCDVIAGHLGGSIFGNFEDEYQPLDRSSVRAAEELEILCAERDELEAKQRRRELTARRST